MKFRTSFLVILAFAIGFSCWCIYFDNKCIDSVSKGEIVEIHRYGRNPELEVKEDVQIIYVWGWPMHSKIFNQSRVRVVRNVSGEFKLHDMVSIEGEGDELTVTVIGSVYHGHLLENSTAVVGRPEDSKLKIIPEKPERKELLK